MSVYVDRKYILQISSQLRNFKQKNENVYNFSCPFCGDSKKKLYKARCYAFVKDNTYLIKCHNCQYVTNVAGLIKHVDYASYSQYCLECFNNKTFIKPETTKISKTTPMFNDEKVIELEPISALPDEHWALNYVKNRKIPEHFWNELYFAPDFRAFVDNVYPTYNKDLPEDDPRLIIPFYNEFKILCGFQGRALKKPEPRYITIKIIEEALKVYGIDKVDVAKTIYVLEGPIDSMFLPNAVATCDSNLTKVINWLPKEKIVLVYDNQYWHKDVRKLLEEAINYDFQVCIFPTNIKEKDINQMVLERHLTLEEIKSIVENNIFSGAKAKLELLNR